MSQENDTWGGTYISISVLEKTFFFEVGLTSLAQGSNFVKFHDFLKKMSKSAEISAKPAKFDHSQETNICMFDHVKYHSDTAYSRRVMNLVRLRSENETTFFSKIS